MADLREGLHLNQPELHYQPKVSLTTGRVEGVEALIRWHHPERGWPPAEFIPLAQIGLKISIDDFGAGYSSLSYLKKLPASEIKLDRALLQDIHTSESARMIVETAISMGHGLGFQVVAEGLETEQAASLK